MSFEKSPDGLSLGQYYGAKTGTMKEPTSALAAYFIDLLEDRMPTIADRLGNTPISYSWFHSGEPQITMISPAVGIAVAPNEHQTLGTYLRTSYGSMIPGTLMTAELTMVIVADSVRMREDISSRILRTLNKAVHNRTESTPIIYLERTGFGDDRGFSSVERYMMQSIFQNTTEDKYLKIDVYEIGYAENYVDEDDPVDWGVIGSFDTGGIAVEDTITQARISSSSFTFKTTFTPNGV